MIVVLKPGASRAQIGELQKIIESSGLHSTVTEGESRTVVTLLGDTARIDPERFETLEAVETVIRITEPYYRAGRKNHPLDTVVSVSPNVCIGGGTFVMIAGPCSVESREQIVQIGTAVKASGAQILRGGAFKPRTSPYDFQGLHEEGISFLAEARKKTGMPVVSEIMSPQDLDLFESIDLIQVGARSMQNFDLLRHLGRQDKPVLLKRAPSGTLKELLMSAEYIMSAGNENVILCERGIRSFEPSSRFTLDLTAIPALKQMTHLPVIVDPSHATGKASFVPSMALAAAAAGADGIMVEVHNDPVHALCDGVQALTLAEFDALAKKIRILRESLF